MYGKWFASAYEGSMFGAGADMFAVWAYIISRTQKGVVEFNADVAAAVIGMEKHQCENVIQKLCEPDTKSRNKDCEGRRLVHLSGFTYHVVNAEHYRSIRNEDDRRAYNSQKQRESRARKKAILDKINVIKMSLTVNDISAVSAQAEAEAEAEAVHSTLLNNIVPEVNSLLENKVQGAKAPSIALQKKETPKIQIPDFIDSEAWKAFEEMRVKIKKPLTDYAKKLAFRNLDRLRADGENVLEVINQSILSDYSGLWPVRKYSNINHEMKIHKSHVPFSDERKSKDFVPMPDIFKKQLEILKKK